MFETARPHIYIYILYHSCSILGGCRSAAAYCNRLDSPTSGVLPVILAEDGSNVAKCFQARWDPGWLPGLQGFSSVVSMVRKNDLCYKHLLRLFQRFQEISNHMHFTCTSHVTIGLIGGSLLASGFRRSLPAAWSTRTMFAYARAVPLVRCPVAAAGTLRMIQSQWNHCASRCSKVRWFFIVFHTWDDWLKWLIWLIFLGWAKTTK